MEYHSFIDSDGKFIGKTKYIKGELIPLPPEEVIKDIRFINHKWRCILPKVKQEKAYDEFYLNNLKNYTKIDDTLLQLEVFCKKNKIIPELKIKENEFNDLASEQQKIVIRSIIEHGFDDVVFIKDGSTSTQIECRNYFTYNYNTKKRELNKIYFRKNVSYSFDLKFDIYVGNKIDFREMNYQIKSFDKKQNDRKVKIEIELPDIGCNANCWYCRQHQKNTEHVSVNSNIINDIIEVIEKVKLIAKAQSENIYFTFLGGELTILNNDIQEKLANKINELIEDDYPCFIFTNGIIKNVPILNTKAYRYVHAIDWKNKTLPKLEGEAQYLITFTERDTEEDINNFLKLNPNLKPNPYPFMPEKNLKTNVVSMLGKRFGFKLKDKRHQIYYCRRRSFYNSKHMTIEIKNNGEKNVYYCCAFKNKKPFKDLKNFIFPDIICPKNCNGV